MLRRTFLSHTVGAALGSAYAQRGLDPRVAKLTPVARPAIAMNHLGFLPRGRKSVIYRLSGALPATEFEMRDISSGPPFRVTRALRRVSSDLGECMVGEFTDIEREGMYQITIAGERSVPFFIRADVWRRTLPKAFSFYPQKRCGVAVPNVHPVCHLDDARRRDNGQYIDTTGGWHDAGDLRKWMTSALLSGAALCHMARNLGQAWNLDGSGLGPVLEELKWGNRYWQKMQDSDGRVFNDVAGGINGDNSDNHWTDNIIGNEDDRYINPSKPNLVQAQFTAVQAMLAQVFRDTDPGYGQQCLGAAMRCWNASTPGSDAIGLAWWVLAALELYRATNQKRWAIETAQLATRLAKLQNKEYVGGQNLLRGFWYVSQENRTPLVHHWMPGLPAIALMEAAGGLPDHPDARAWRDAVRLFLDEYVLPLTSRNAYRIVPYGIFYGSPSPERYRPLAGELTYRYFMPVARGAHGLTSHYESFATTLAMAGRAFQSREYTDLAYRQLEWVMGANPFGACLMTGEGMRNPYPHSRYEGLIVGAIMNGMGGNENDDPVLDTENGFDWHTTEYWQPHNAWYLWAHSILEAGK